MCCMAMGNVYKKLIQRHKPHIKLPETELGLHSEVRYSTEEAELNGTGKSLTYPSLRGTSRSWTCVTDSNVLHSQEFCSRLLGI
jgi:hypothetical protein